MLIESANNFQSENGLMAITDIKYTIYLKSTGCVIDPTKQYLGF